jgi:ABC-type bacteriocin/lantibiotic exporter with double-glycine peptidase domain
MNSKKIMTYSIALLAAIIVLKIMVSISWKLILISLFGLGLWFLVDKVIKPQIKKWQELEILKS